jgi:MFS family permease
MGDTPTPSHPLHGLILPDLLRFLSLAMFFITNTKDLDRGAVSASLTAILKELDKGDTEGGLLFGGFLVGYTISSPFFASWSNSTRPMRLMAVGLLVWCLANVGTALAPEYFTLLLARSISGIGEASFLCLAPVSFILH